jgi:hypothetical protein
MRHKLQAKKGNRRSILGTTKRAERNYEHAGLTMTVLKNLRRLPAVWVIWR